MKLTVVLLHAIINTLLAVSNSTGPMYIGRRVQEYKVTHVRIFGKNREREIFNQVQVWS